MPESKWRDKAAFDAINRVLLVRITGWRSEAILDIYNIGLGAFLFASPWLFAFAHGAVREDAWMTGALVVLLSIGALVAFAEWEEWINLILGLWIAASPWVLGFLHTAAMQVCIAVGILVAYIAAIELMLIHAGTSQASGSRS